MKRALTGLVCIACLLAMAVPGVAAIWRSFANRDTVKVFAKMDTDSKVVKKLAGGTEVDMEGNYEDWYGIYYEDKNGDRKVGYVLAKQMSFAMPEKYCTHNWSAWDVLTEATCTQNGVRTRECSVCAKVERKEIPKLGHEYGQWTVIEEASCTEEGEQVRKCKRCGHREQKEIAKLDHEYGQWIVVEEPTCTEKGKRVRRCIICAHRDVQELQMLPHEYGKWTVTSEASCTEEGKRVRKCVICGHRDTEAIEKLPHEYGKWTVIREATCTRQGKRTRTCGVCGYAQSQNMDMLPHEYRWQTTVKSTDHSAGMRARVCTVCGEIAAEESFDPKGTLRRGARGDDVRQIQQQLVDQGYLKTGGVDGIFGPGLERAIMQFQLDQGLQPDGVAWPQTIQRLNHDFGEWRAIKKATRTIDGEYVRTCLDCGYEQHRVVSAGTSYQRRDHSEAIRTIQKVLNELGYPAGTADGSYGPKLDNAFEAFAAENDMDFVQGSLAAADVDALFNAWIGGASSAEWMGRGDKDSPVRLTLTVTAAQEDEDPFDAERTYNWRLINIGTQSCRFEAILLNFGDSPDFRGDDLVVALDGVDLRRDGSNSASGSFTVARDWGEGKLNFCALGVSSGSGALWLSNIRSFEE